VDGSYGGAYKQEKKRFSRSFGVGTGLPGKRVKDQQEKGFLIKGGRSGGQVSINLRLGKGQVPQINKKGEKG